MKIRTLYSCECCHTDYNTEEKAIACEKSHRQKLSIMDTKYLGFNVDACPFPAKIKVVSTETNEAYWYYRKHKNEEEFVDVKEGINDCKRIN